MTTREKLKLLLMGCKSFPAGCRFSSLLNLNRISGSFYLNTGSNRLTLTVKICLDTSSPGTSAPDPDTLLVAVCPRTSVVITELKEVGKNKD